MRNAFSEELYAQKKKNKKIFILAADISPSGKMAEIASKNNPQIINVGVAEQLMIGLSAGLALKKNIVFNYTIAPFSLYRPFEMVRNDLCLQNLPVTIVGMGAGTIYSELGPTHMSQEDISIARSLPNMKIIAPCDTLELKSAIKYCVKNKSGPIYLRIGKSGEEVLTGECKNEWVFGKIRKLKNGKRACILTYGPITNIAFEICKDIKSNISIYNCHTLKPFDYSSLKKIFNNYSKIIIIEDHSIIGGLSSIVMSYLGELGYKKKIFKFSLQDKFLNSYDSQKNLLKKHGIDKKIIIKKTGLK